MKFAYFGIPHIGGTYTVYHSLRVGLAPHGISVTWLGLGPQAQLAYDDPCWVHEREHGVVLAGETDDDRLQAETLIRYLESSDFSGVFVNVLAGRVETNAMRYLDPAIKRVMIVHNITLGTYAAARAVRDYVHATVGVSPRIKNDLITHHGFQEACTHAIPNAIDLQAFAVSRTERQNDTLLRVLFLGRIIDTDKGVFGLPRIMDRLRDCPVHLTIAGDGPDRAELERRCAPLGDRVRFLGRIPPDRVPEVLAAHDVFLFPSRFEGLPLSLVEAMASGCVPVASRIKGVTDFVVTDGADGLLFDLGDARAAARHIRQLAEDRALLARLAGAARQNVAGRFELDALARDYADVVHKVLDAPRPIRAPLPIDAWSYPAGLRPGLRTYLPNGVKKWLRVWRERFA